MIKRLLILLPFALLGSSCSLQAALHSQPQTPAAAEEKPGDLMIVYPQDNSTIFAPSTFFIGSIAPAKHLTCNGDSVQINKDGFFAQVVNLHLGSNEFTLKTDSTSRIMHITRSAALNPIVDAKALQVDKDSLEPKENMGVTAGDTVLLAVRATPGSIVTAQIGKNKIKLFPPNKTHFNAGVSYAYGTSLQNSPVQDAALSLGFYRISSSDNFQQTPVKYLIEKYGQVAHLSSAGDITVCSEMKPATTLHSNTIVRVGPSKSRVTPLPEDIKLLVDGWVGNSMRCWLAPDHHVFILKTDLSLNDASVPAPNAVIRTVNVKENPDGAIVSIPLNQRLPFQIEQQLNPNKLILKIFGAAADTDWITQSPNTSSLINHVSWKQPSDQIYELTVHLQGKRQWGFWANYEDHALVLHIKAPPHLVSDQKLLSGLTICLDPGHGGSETGAIGPSGIPESAINLSIATKLKDLLTADGARIIMTRESNTNNLSLEDRVQTAINSKADLLISIHNNALPDGRDPINEHGTSTYWYHPQSLELSEKLRQSLVHQIGFADLGTFYQNLALIRPSNMPAVLVETGFMINPDEYSQLITSETQTKIAQALQAGIVSYIQDINSPATK